MSTVSPQSTLTIQQRVNVLANTSIEAIALQDVRYVRSEWQPVISIEPPTLNANDQCPVDEILGGVLMAQAVDPTPVVYICATKT